MPVSRISFPVLTESLGRNGVMKTSGLEFLSTGETLNIFPVTSRGIAGRCRIEIPEDRATIQAMIAELQSIDAELERRENQAS